MPQHPLLPASLSTTEGWLGAPFSSTVTLIQPLCGRHAFFTFSQSAQEQKEFRHYVKSPRKPEEPPRGPGSNLSYDSFQARTVRSHSLFLPQLRLEPHIPSLVQPPQSWSNSQNIHQNPSILLTISLLPQKPRFFLRALRYSTQEKEKDGENQFVANDKIMATNHFGGFWERP